MKRILTIVLLTGGIIAAGLSLGCNDSETQKADFSSGSCKSDGVPATLPAGSTTDDYDGLQCVSYMTQPNGDLSLNIINASGYCSPYDGFIQNATNNSVDIMIRPEDCGNIPRCSCPHDYEFSISGLDASTDVTLTIENQQCPAGEVWCTSSAVLPIKTSSSGMACQYMSGGESGNLFDRCSLDTDVGLPCDGALVCAALNSEPTEDKLYCFAPCTTDADCPAPGALHCADDGLCRIATELSYKCE